MASPTAQGEGFVLTTRDGVSYRFDVYVERDFPTVRVGALTNCAKPSTCSRARSRIATGNWVHYAYNGNGHPDIDHFQRWPRDHADVQRFAE